MPASLSFVFVLSSLLPVLSQNHLHQNHSKAMSSTLFPATEALRTQERIRPRGNACTKVDFNMNSIFEQAIALDSAKFTPFPAIAWTFESDNEDEGTSKNDKKGKKTMKQFDDHFKAHRRHMHSKHSSSNRMVRSKAQFNGLSCLGSSSSSMHSLHSFVIIDA